jgi:hypothetical protein
MANLAPATDSVATDRTRAMAPLDGFTAAERESLTEAERREISLIEHQGGRTFEDRENRANAAAELDALSLLVSAVPSQNPSIYPYSESLQGKWTERCPNMAGILLKGAGQAISSCTVTPSKLTRAWAREHSCSPTWSTQPGCKQHSATTDG